MLVGVLGNLEPSRFRSIVCCIQDRGALADEVEALGVPVFALDHMQRGGYDRRVVPALRRLMREQKIDLVHTHLYHANFYGRIAAVLESIPVIASVHNTYTRTKWHRRLINSFLARRTFALTAGSREVERDLVEIDRAPPGKIVRLPNCIDLARVDTTLTRENARLQLGFRAGDHIIGTVGRAEEQKGQAFLLEAFAQVRASSGNNSLKLLVVGDGRLLPRLKEQAVRLGIAEHCRFPGNIARLADVYRAMDMFVLPSLWEGLSLALLEAMAAEVPVIATDVGGSREVLGENKFGLIIPPQSAEAIVNAVAKIFADPAATAIRTSTGAKHVSANFSVKSLAARLSALYVSAVSPSVPRA